MLRSKCTLRKRRPAGDPVVVAAVIVLSTLASGCSTRGSESGDSACGSESGAVGPVQHFREVNRIGSVNDERYAFSMPIAVAATDLEIYVVDGSPVRGARFTEDGRWIADFAHSGMGPGELVGAGTVGLTLDTLWVADPHGARMELYRPDGTFIMSLRFNLDSDSLGTRFVPRALLEDGSVLVGPAGIQVGAVTAGRVDHAAWARTTRAGEILSTVYRDPLVTADFYHTSMGRGGGRIIGITPLPQSPLVAPFADGSGLVAVERRASQTPDSASYTVTRYDAEGTVAWTTQVPYAPCATTGFLDAWLSKSLQGSGPRNPEVARTLRNAIPVPPFYPPVTSVVPGNDGTVWLRREEAASDSVVWEVLNAQGRLSSTVVTPASLQIVAASAKEVWGVVTGAMDVPYLVHAAIR
jgi:hypothetical protein